MSSRALRSATAVDIDEVWFTDALIEVSPGNAPS